MSFNIVNVFRYDSETVKVCVKMDAKEWHKLNKARGGLGQLYGIDISNEVYRSYGVKAYNPTVNDSSRASNGIKTIFLTYQDSEWQECKAPSNVINVDFQAKARLDGPVRYKPLMRGASDLPETDNLIKVDFVSKTRIAS